MKRKSFIMRIPLDKVDVDTQKLWRWVEPQLKIQKEYLKHAIDTKKPPTKGRL